MKRDTCPICHLPRYRLNRPAKTPVASTYCLKHYRTFKRHGHPLMRQIPRSLWDVRQHRPAPLKDARQFLVKFWTAEETREALRLVENVLDPATVPSLKYPRLVPSLKRLRTDHRPVTPRRALSVVLALHLAIDANPRLLPKSATGDVLWIAVTRAVLGLKYRVSKHSPLGLNALRLIAGRLQSRLSPFVAFAMRNMDAVYEERRYDVATLHPDYGKTPLLGPFRHRVSVAEAVARKLNGTWAEDTKQRYLED